MEVELDLEQNLLDKQTLINFIPAEFEKIITDDFGNIGRQEIFGWLIVETPINEIIESLGKGGQNGLRESF